MCCSKRWTTARGCSLDRQYAREKIDDQMCVHVDEDQVRTDEPVFQLRGQRRELGEHPRPQRCAGTPWPCGVDRQRRRSGALCIPVGRELRGVAVVAPQYASDPDTDQRGDVCGEDIALTCTVTT